MKIQLLKFIFFSGLLFFLESCSPSKLIPQDKRVTLDQSNLTSINGRYDNYSTDTTAFRRTSFWSQLKPFHRDTSYDLNYDGPIQNSTIEIKIISKTKIQFDLYDHGTLKKSKKFRFKNKDGIIKIKGINNFRLYGIPLIFYSGHHETLNLGLDSHSNLLLGYEGMSSGGILIFIFGAPKIGTGLFKRQLTQPLR